MAEAHAFCIWAALSSAAVAALGFIIGVWTAGRSHQKKLSGRRRDDLCECGTILPRTCTPEEVERHKSSTRHRRNMLRFGRSSEVVVCEEVGEYRAAAQCLVKGTDHVLEVGCPRGWYVEGFGCSRR